MLVPAMRDFSSLISGEFASFLMRILSISFPASMASMTARTPNIIFCSLTRCTLYLCCGVLDVGTFISSYNYFTIVLDFLVFLDFLVILDYLVFLDFLAFLVFLVFLDYLVFLGYLAFLLFCASAAPPLAGEVPAGRRGRSIILVFLDFLVYLVFLDFLANLVFLSFSLL